MHLWRGISMEVPLLGQTTPAPEETKVLEGVSATAAFLLYLDKDGNVVMSPDINIAITTERTPTIHEIKGALQTVLDDLRTQETAILAAQHVVNMQMQLGRAAQEARMNQQIMNQLPQGMAG